MEILEDASRLLGAYPRAVLASVSWLPYPEGISRGVSEMMLMYLLNERNQLG